MEFANVILTAHCVITGLILCHTTRTLWKVFDYFSTGLATRRLLILLLSTIPFLIWVGFFITLICWGAVPLKGFEIFLYFLLLNVICLTLEMYCSFYVRLRGKCIRFPSTAQHHGLLKSFADQQLAKNSPKITWMYTDTGQEYGGAVTWMQFGPLRRTTTSILSIENGHITSSGEQIKFLFELPDRKSVWHVYRAPSVGWTELGASILTLRDRFWRYPFLDQAPRDACEYPDRFLIPGQVLALRNKESRAGYDATAVYIGDGKVVYYGYPPPETPNEEKVKGPSARLDLLERFIGKDLRESWSEFYESFPGLLVMTFPVRERTLDEIRDEALEMAEQHWEQGASQRLFPKMQKSIALVCATGRSLSNMEEIQCYPMCCKTYPPKWFMIDVHYNPKTSHPV